MSNYKATVGFVDTKSEWKDDKNMTDEHRMVVAGRRYQKAIRERGSRDVRVVGYPSQYLPAIHKPTK